MAKVASKGKGSLSYLTKEGFRNVRVHKLMTLASVTVLLACLVIIGSAFMLYVNINDIISRVGEQNVIMVFITDGTESEKELVLKSEIENIDAVKDCVYVSNDEAFGDILSNMSEESQIFNGEDGSFLPNAFKVTITDMDKFGETVKTIKGFDNVLQVRENSDLASKLVTIKQAIGYLCGTMVIVLFIVALFIIANTIRITMFSRKLEISIMKAVGATNWFIRWPFVIEGVIIGIMASVLAFGCLAGIYALAGSMFTELFTLLGGEIVPFGNYMWYILAVYAGVGMFTGIFGSSISLGKYLKEQGQVVENE